jgi:hypothetical protein
VDGQSTPFSLSENIAEAAQRLRSGESEAAIAALRAAGAQDGDDLRVHFLTALVAWDIGDIAQALLLVRSCFDRQPENGTLAEVLASLYAQSGELLDSLFYGKIATALGPDPVLNEWLPPAFPSFGKAFLSIRDKPLLAQSRLLLAGGKRAGALDKARQHVQVAPRDAEGRHFYAELLLHAGQPAVAVETLEPLLSEGTAPPATTSLIARALSAAGEAETARHWHERAGAAAPDSAAIAAARIADAPWLGVAADERARWVKDWIGRFTRPPKPRRLKRPGAALVVGCLVSHLGDPSDAAAVAAVARALRQRGASVVGYGLGALAWEENAPLREAFGKWRDITGVDHATLAKIMSGDGLDLAIDACGFAAPDTLRALARLDTVLRAAWIIDPSGLEGRVYDAVIGARTTATDLTAWPSPDGAYPLLRDWTRRREHLPDGNFRFGADVSLAQIDDATAALWRGALAAAPKAMLLLRGNSLDHPGNVARLMRRFGEFAARIDLVAAMEADEFYRQIDLALAPRHGPSARMAAEALGCGVPVVALTAGGGAAPYPALLSALGLEGLVAASPEAYVALAAELAAAPEKRERTAAAVAAIAARGEEGAARIAGAIEDAAREALGRAAA